MKRNLDFLNDSVGKKERDGFFASAFGGGGASSGLCKNRVSLLFDEINNGTNSRNFSPRSGSPNITLRSSRNRNSNEKSSGDSKTLKGDYSTNIYISQSQSVLNNLLN